MRFLRILLRIVAALVAIVIVLLFFLLGSAAVPDHSDYQLDLTTLRKLAAEQKGPQPQRLNAAVVCDAKVPAAFFLGGWRLDRYHAVFPSYQIVAPDGFVIVDAPPGRDFWQKGFPGQFNQDQFDSVQAAMIKARAIVITHEHEDHLGGIAQSDHLADFAPRLVFSSEQLHDDRFMTAAKFPNQVRAGLHAAEFDHYYALAPGVVLIKAPGHTVGSEIIYVHLANDAEFLLIGDVAWAMQQVSTPKCRPRGPELMMGENSSQVTNELRTLHDLAQNNPSLHIVVSHDAEQLYGYQQAGLIGAKFE